MLLDLAIAVTLLTVGMFVLTRLKEVVPGRVVKKALSFIKNYFLKPTRRTNYPNLSCYKTLHVSGIFFAHHQGFSTWAKMMPETCRVL